MKKIIIIIAITVLVLGGGLLAWSRFRTSVVVAPPVTAKAERGPIRQVIPSNGKITSNLDVDIKCKASGEIIYLPYDVSDVVDIQKPLMRLDPVDEDRHVEQARVSLKMSEARLKTAQTNELVAQRNLVTERMRAEASLKSAEAKAKDLRAKANRIGELKQRKLASQEDYETADTTAVAAETDLEVARAKTKDIETQEQALALTRQAVLLAEAQLRNDSISLDLALQQRQNTEVLMPDNPGLTGDAATKPTSQPNTNPATQPDSEPATQPAISPADQFAMSAPATQPDSHPAGKAGGRDRGKGRDKDTERLLKALDYEPTTGPAPAPKWVVTARNVQIGQIVSSGITTVGGGTTVLTVSDLSRIFVLAAVDESDIGKVKVGQKVITTVDAFPGKKFPGRVVRIATKGVNSSNVVTFEVKILVVSPDQNLLKPEMTANVEIICAEKDSAIFVPSDAIVRKAGKSMVSVIDATGATVEKQVEVGINDGTNVEITDGLNEGDTVILRKDNADSKWKGGQAPPMNPGRMMGGGR